MRTIILTAAVVALTTAVATAQNCKFASEFPPGVYVVTAEHVQTQMLGVRAGRTMTQTNKMIITAELKADKPADKSQMLHLTFKRLQMDVFRMDRRMMGFDSANPPTGNDAQSMAGMMLKQFEPLIGATFDITLDADGKVAKIEGMDKLDTTDLMNSRFKMVFTDELFRSMLGERYVTSPGKPVAKGAAWKMKRQQRLVDQTIVDTTLDLKCTLADVKQAGKDRIAVVKFAGADKKGPVAQSADVAPHMNDLASLEETCTGTVRFNLDTGRAEEVTVEKKSKGEMKSRKPQGKTTPLGQTETIKVTITKGKYKAEEAAAERPAEAADQSISNPSAPHLVQPRDLSYGVVG